MSTFCPFQVQVDDNGRVLEVVRSKEKQHVGKNAVSVICDPPPWITIVPCFTESIPRSALLTPDTNLAAYAGSIVEGCKYVHNSRSEEVEQLLIKVTAPSLFFNPDLDLLFLSRYDLVFKVEEEYFVSQ